MMFSQTIRTLGIAVLLLLPAIAAAQTDAELQKGKEHFAIGVDLLDESPPNYRDALAQFRRAYSLTHSWKVLGNLGLCAHRLERDGEATRYYKQYLKKGGKDISAAERRDIERDLVAISASLVKVVLTADVAQASIIVLRTGSSDPGQVYALENYRVSLGLRAGAYRILAQVASDERRWSAVFAPAEKALHRFSFQSGDDAPTSGAGLGAAAPVRATSPTQADAGLSSSHRSTVGYVTAGLGVAAFGTGVFFDVQSRQQAAAARAAVAADPALCMNGVCSAAAEEAFGPADTSRLLSTALYAGGGALALTGLIVLLTADDDSDRGAGARASVARKPAPDGRGGGLVSEHGVVSDPASKSAIYLSPILNSQYLGLQLGGTFQ